MTRARSNDLIVDVPIENMMFLDPFENLVWAGLRKPVRASQVEKAISRDAFIKTPLPDFPSRHIRPYEHERRIAFLVVHGWSDPVHVDVGVPFLGRSIDWVLTDGNHRLAAAIYRKDSTISVIVSGQIDYAEKLLGVKIARTKKREANRL